jgi:hypothetical protein
MMNQDFRAPHDLHRDLRVRVAAAIATGAPAQQDPDRDHRLHGLAEVISVIGQACGFENRRVCQRPQARVRLVSRWPQDHG